MTFTDTNGNRVTKEGAEIYLYLISEPERRRHLGSIIGDAFFVQRKSFDHWMNIFECWALNNDVIQHHKDFGFKRVWLVGVDGHGKEWDIKRSVKDVLEWGHVFGYKTAGMEVQITFQIQEGPYKSYVTERRNRV